MKKRAIIVALMMVCAVLAVHAVGFNPFGYAESVRNRGSIIDVGIGYGWGFDIHATFDKIVPINAGSNTLPFAFGGMVDIALGDGLSLAVDGRATWHFDFDIPQFDMYLGPAIGFAIYGIGGRADGEFKFDWGGTFGVRWAFTDSMAAFFETGYTGLTYAKAGVSFYM